MIVTNFYSSDEIDRATHLRDDKAWLTERLTDPTTRFIPVWRTYNLFEVGNEQVPALLTQENVNIKDADEVIFLGLIGNTAYFALDFSSLIEPPLDSLGKFRDLRSSGALLAHTIGSLLAFARGIVYWHVRHQFCGECGALTLSKFAGHQRICSNENCGAPCFPRTDPAVIMAVYHDDRLLMGRQIRWPTGMYSVLAGFVEPGESLEDAVAREIFEEVGIEIEDIQYHSSQPWPFPSSIMLGFMARAVTTDLVIDRTELEDARWYSRDDLICTANSDNFRLPNKDSIARQLVEDWLNQ